MNRLALIGLRTLLTSSREGDAALADALRAFRAGSDRGELRALLVEAWGPSPKSAPTPGELGHIADVKEIEARLASKVASIVERGASDLRGLAARESQPHVNIRDAQAADEQLADLARGPRL